MSSYRTRWQLPGCFSSTAAIAAAPSQPVPGQRHHRVAGRVGDVPVEPVPVQPPRARLQPGADHVHRVPVQADKPRARVNPQQQARVRGGAQALIAVELLAPAGQVRRRHQVHRRAGCQRSRPPGMSGGASPRCSDSGAPSISDHTTANCEQSDGMFVSGGQARSGCVSRIRRSKVDPDRPMHNTNTDPSPDRRCRDHPPGRATTAEPECSTGTFLTGRIHWDNESLRRHHDHLAPHRTRIAAASPGPSAAREPLRPQGPGDFGGSVSCCDEICVLAFM